MPKNCTKNEEKTEKTNKSKEEKNAGKKIQVK